jgi:hypothetical protein
MAKTRAVEQRSVVQHARGKLADFAEDLGNLFGTTERKATQWLSQRENVAKQLSAIRDKASSLLQQLGSVAGESPLPWRRTKTAGRRRGRPPGSKNKQTTAAEAAKSTRRRKRKPMSAEARAKIAAAQRARWAKQKKAKNG